MTVPADHGVRRDQRIQHRLLYGIHDGREHVVQPIPRQKPQLLCYANEQFLLVTTATTIVAVYAALCLSAVRGRRNGSTGHAAYRMPLYPVAPGSCAARPTSSPITVNHWSSPSS